MAEPVTVEELLAYLGADDSDETRGMVSRMRDAAVEDICRATGIDWRERVKKEAFCEAVRVSVWMSYYAARDGAKNTVFLGEYRNGLICSLQLCGGEGDDDAV